MTHPTRKIVNRSENLIGEYHLHSLQELNQLCANAIAQYVLPEFADKAQFGIEKYNHPYDESTYVGFFIYYQDYEKEEERKERETLEENYRIAQESRERAEFHRLSKKFATE